MCKMSCVTRSVKPDKHEQEQRAEYPEKGDIHKINRPLAVFTCTTFLLFKCHVSVYVISAVSEPVGELLRNEGGLCFDSVTRHL